MNFNEADTFTWWCEDMGLADCEVPGPLHWCPTGLVCSGCWVAGLFGLVDAGRCA